MEPGDFVYNQIFKGAKKRGAGERFAQRYAILGLEDFKKNKIDKKVSNLIESRIKEAVKQSKRNAN